VLNPGGKLLIVDLSTPIKPLARAIARMAFGGMLEHDMCELLPLLQENSFSKAEYDLAKFRILGLSVIGYIRGNAAKV
jgi:hypothetical protein